MEEEEKKAPCQEPQENTSNEDDTLTLVMGYKSKDHSSVDFKVTGSHKGELLVMLPYVAGECIGAQMAESQIATTMNREMLNRFYNGLINGYKEHKKK